jgi:hypothetical protein
MGTGAPQRQFSPPPVLPVPQVPPQVPQERPVPLVPPVLREQPEQQ